MLVEIKAKFECDSCGIKFTVKIDPAWKSPINWSLYEVAEDAIRGGQAYEDEADYPHCFRFGSVRDNKHLCALCSSTDLD